MTSVPELHAYQSALDKERIELCTHKQHNYETNNKTESRKQSNWK